MEINKMKAYYLDMKDDPDAGAEIVFANTVREAKKQAIGKDFYEESGEWIYLQCKRIKKFDGMETLSKMELVKECWRDGWWFSEGNCPDTDESTDEDFYKWYKNAFGNPNGDKR